MAFELPKLPFKKDALKPHISEETLDFHYGKHHNAYVNKLNELVAGGEYSNSSLEDIIKKAAPGPIFNNAAQVWNHSFYWNCLSPNGGKEPTGDVLAALTKNFGSFAQFKEKFTNTAISTFGSGWAWVVQKKSGSLEIVSTSNAQNPLTSGDKPILTCDVWEHAYYIDYRNLRPKYVDAFWNLVNWDFMKTNLK